MKKRVLSMLMALALCLTLLPAPVRAAKDTPESGAIVQQEQQEEISPAVSEQAGTNEEENGSEGDPQNTGRKRTRLNSSHVRTSRMPSSA